MSVEAETPFELMYVHGEETAAVILLQQTLLAKLAANAPLRSGADIERYTRELAQFGPEGIVAEVSGEMGEDQLKFVLNKYPYVEVAAVLPAGTDWQHLCLWSRNGGLTREVISQEIDRQFPGRSALVFIHGEQMRSIKNMTHAHVIMVG